MCGTLAQSGTPSAEGKPAGGASAAPAGGRIRPAPRAASGIKQTGITTGRGGASLDWDWRARVTPVEERKVSAPRLERPLRTGRPASSQEAWPEVDACGPRGPRVRAAVERRQASPPQKGGCRARARRLLNSVLSAFCLPFFLFWFRSPDERSEIRDQSSSFLVVPGCRFAHPGYIAGKNSGANQKTRRDNGRARPPRAAGRHAATRKDFAMSKQTAS